MDAVKSEMASGVDYDPVAKRIIVYFHTGGSRPYGPFEPHEYDAFRRAPSIGKHFHMYIKKKAVR